MSSNVYDDVTDCEDWGLPKNTKIWISCGQNIVFSSNKKFIHCTLRVITWQK